MFKLFSLICVSLTISSVFSAESRIPKETPPPKYEGQPGCYNKDLDIMLPLNELYSPNNGKCEGFLCKESGETIVQSCGVVSAPGCTFTEDLSLPYPQCCKQYDCSSSDQPEAEVA